MKEISLVDSPQLDHRNPDIENILIKYLQQQVQDLLKSSEIMNKSNKLPLVRLTVNQNDFPSIRNIRFAQLFLKLVANPSSILKFRKKRVNKVTSDITGISGHGPTSQGQSLETIINTMIQSDSVQLKVLKKEDINRASIYYYYYIFIVKECTKSRSLEWKKFIADTVQTVQTKLNRTRKELMKDLTESNTERAINSLKSDGIESDELLSILHKVNDIINGEKAPILQPIQSMDMEEDENENEIIISNKSSTEKKKRKTTTATRGGGKRRGRGGKGGSNRVNDSDDNDIEDIDDDISNDDDDDEKEVVVVTVYRYFYFIYRRRVEEEVEEVVEEEVKRN